MNARTETIDDRITTLLREIAPAALDAGRIKARFKAPLSEIESALERLVASGHATAIDVMVPGAKPTVQYRVGPGMPDTFRPLKPRPFGARIVPRQTARIPETRIEDLPKPAPERRTLIANPDATPVGIPARQHAIREQASDRAIERTATKEKVVQTKVCREADTTIPSSAAQHATPSAKAADGAGGVRDPIGDAREESLIAAEAQALRHPASRAPGGGPAELCLGVLRSEPGRKWTAAQVAETTGLSIDRVASTLAAQVDRGKCTRERGNNPNAKSVKGGRPYAWWYWVPKTKATKKSPLASDRQDASVDVAAEAQSAVQTHGPGGAVFAKAYDVQLPTPTPAMRMAEAIIAQNERIIAINEQLMKIVSAPQFVALPGRGLK